MNNEPVAWAIKSDNDFTEVGFDNELLEEVEQMYAMEGWKYEVIPLYTHPAKTLTPLTEDECEAIINKHDWFSKSWREMAKEIHDAILRKAQEK